ncbi:hypothetical protein D8674_008465 [Pyrus ussuriensis x Pyrus communis]|uniref:Uncharacterized protein n=1 Tax=Pyrus ussuriensis x Pyrus communis TaxID=2448454 RepID=A0A5N5HSU6_9ROSA|nr:hypothetical protein D8674_008465 [Pyrus ussuriensis x Pyrus communis]
MSHLIRSCKTVSNAPHSIPPPPILPATTPTKIDHRPVNLVDPIGPGVSEVQASSAFLVAQPVSARRGHRRPRTPDTSASTTDALGSQQGKHTNYNFNDINDDMLAYVNRLFTERYKQWKRGSKFPEINVFCNVYVQPGDELAKSLHPDLTDYTGPQSVRHSSSRSSSPVDIRAPPTRACSFDL